MPWSWRYDDLLDGGVRMYVLERHRAAAARHATRLPPVLDLVVREGDAATLYVYDGIETRAEKGGVSAKAVAMALRTAQGVRTLHVRINSPGGDVGETQAILALLRAHPARKVVHVDGLAASAGAWLTAVGDEVLIAPGGEMMIHGVRFSTFSGTAQELREGAARVEASTEAMVADFVRRTKQPAEKIREWLTRDTYLTAAEAVRLGFADRIEGEEAKQRRVASRSAAAVLRASRAARLVARARRARRAAGGAM